MLLLGHFFINLFLKKHYFYYEGTKLLNLFSPAEPKFFFLPAQVTTGFVWVLLEEYVEKEVCNQ